LRLETPSISLVAALLCACGAHGLVPAEPTGALHGPSDGALEHDALRTKNLHTRLHARARELIMHEGREASWVRDAVLKLPAQACADAVRVAPPSGAECTLLALDHGAVALLVLREGSCSSEACTEHSWVFLPAYRAALPLPSLRTADFHALRAELPSDTAAVLWLAGFRGASSGGHVADARELRAPYGPFASHGYGEEPALPPLADYTSCTLAPDQHELLCRSEAGDVLGIDAASGATRLVAELGIPRERIDSSQGALAHAPVSFTREGQLVVRVQADDARCGQGPCELVSFLDWPIARPGPVELTRAD
jgi:hypothetical protein